MIITDGNGTQWKQPTDKVDDSNIKYDSLHIFNFWGINRIKHTHVYMYTSISTSNLPKSTHYKLSRAPHPSTLHLAETNLFLFIQSWPALLNTWKDQHCRILSSPVLPNTCLSSLLPDCHVVRKLISIACHAIGHLHLYIYSAAWCLVAMLMYNS